MHRVLGLRPLLTRTTSVNRIRLLSPAVTVNRVLRSPVPLSATRPRQFGRMLSSQPTASTGTSTGTVASANSNNTPAATAAAATSNNTAAPRAREEQKQSNDDSKSQSGGSGSGSEKPVWPLRFSREWWLAMIVFSVTGSTAAFAIRPLFSQLGLEGSLRNGPWTYYACYIPAMTLCYSLLLNLIGRAVGMNHFFGPFSKRTLRLLAFPFLFAARRMGFVKPK